MSVISDKILYLTLLYFTLLKESFRFDLETDKPAIALSEIGFSFDIIYLFDFNEI